MSRPCSTAAIGLSLVACAHSSLEMEVMFANPDGLRVGSEVRIDDTRVGEVRSLEKHGDDVAVGITVEQQHRERITADSRFHIERAGLLSSTRYLAVEPGPGAASRDGARVRGVDSLSERISGWAKEAAEWLTRDDLRDQLSEFDRAVRDAAAQGNDALERARPTLEDKAAELVELARDHGPEAADKMKAMLDEILDAVED